MIRWDNHAVLTYRANAALKYPHFSLLAGPVSGLPLTTDSSLPYPHHRGLWLGCDPLNGGDYWSDGPLATGQIRSEELTIEDQGDNGVTILNRCRWVHGEGSNPLRDKRKFCFERINSQLSFIDVHLEIEALEDILIREAKHSFFALRVAADLAPSGGGNIVSSEGNQGAEHTHGRPARWCSFYGRRKKCPAVVEGISIFNHPDNFGCDCPWFVRAYGHMSASPFGFLKKNWTLERGRKLDLRYGVALHAGNPNTAKIQPLYDGWLAKHASNTVEIIGRKRKKRR